MSFNKLELVELTEKADYKGLILEVGTRLLVLGEARVGPDMLKVDIGDVYRYDKYHVHKSKVRKVSETGKTQEVLLDEWKKDLEKRCRHSFPGVYDVGTNVDLSKHSPLYKKMVNLYKKKIDSKFPDDGTIRLISAGMDTDRIIDGIEDFASLAYVKVDVVEGSFFGPRTPFAVIEPEYLRAIPGATCNETCTVVAKFLEQKHTQAPADWGVWELPPWRAPHRVTTPEPAGYSSDEDRKDRWSEVKGFGGLGQFFAWKLIMNIKDINLRGNILFKRQLQSALTANAARKGARSRSLCGKERGPRSACGDLYDDVVAHYQDLEEFLNYVKDIQHVLSKIEDFDQFHPDILNCLYDKNEEMRQHQKQLVKDVDVIVKLKNLDWSKKYIISINEKIMEHLIAAINHLKDAVGRNVRGETTSVHRVGDVVQVFSKGADRWLDGRVVAVTDARHVTVEYYNPRYAHMRKTMSADSGDLRNVRGDHAAVQSAITSYLDTIDWLAGLWWQVTPVMERLAPVVRIRDVVEEDTIKSWMAGNRDIGSSPPALHLAAVTRKQLSEWKYGDTRRAQRDVDETATDVAVAPVSTSDSVVPSIRARTAELSLISPNKVRVTPSEGPKLTKEDSTPLEGDRIDLLPPPVPPAIDLAPDLINPDEWSLGDAESSSVPMMHRDGEDSPPLEAPTLPDVAAADPSVMSMFDDPYTPWMAQARQGAKSRKVRERWQESIENVIRRLRGEEGEPASEEQGVMTKDERKAALIQGVGFGGGTRRLTRRKKNKRKMKKTRKRSIKKTHKRKMKLSKRR